MSNPNLASIESIQDEIIDFSISAENFSYTSWLPLLLKWKNVLENSCRELSSNRFSVDFNLLRGNTKKNLLRLQDELKINCSTAISIMGDEKIIDGFYEEIEKEIDDQNDLHKEDLYVILYVTLGRLLYRIEQDDYSGFYELSSIQEGIAMKDKGPEKKAKKNIQSQDLSYKQIAWVILFRNEHFYESDFAKHYPNYDARTVYNRRSRLIKDRTSIEDGLPPEYCGRAAIVKDLNKVIDFFKNNNEIIQMNKAIMIRDLTNEKLNGEI